ncbi:MAG: MFS transporter [Notoacmeibacter sp.]|nr:MFS transporter [Notoacmeibacter sp.]MCC0032008.1 MFS transporter [Brucellaceae bacterium]
MSIISNRWAFLALACLAELLALTTWFSATAIMPELQARWQLGAGTSAWLTNGVQAGFVTGALSLAFSGLPDRVALHRLTACAALVAALANLSLLADLGAGMAIAARIATGMALAGVYPPTVKLLATWFRAGRGFAMGLLIGSLTLGSSVPHLVRALGGGADWRTVVIASSAAAALAAGLFAFALREGPYPFARTVVNLRQLGTILRDRPVMLANMGYFGHMWELYALWGWFLAYASAAKAAGNTLSGLNASLLTFAVVGIGIAGAAGGGLLADRIGRCRATALAMGVSGLSAFLIGFAFDGPAWAFILIALVWGISIIADSAQFSAAVTELADPTRVGSALAFQMGVGFAITIGVIWLLPVAAGFFGSWRWVFLILVPGPLAGIWAMLTLRTLPASEKMAGGLR